MIQKKTIIIIFATLLLSACVYKPAQYVLGQHHLSWEQREQQVTKINAWTLRGRVALVTAEQNGNASFLWQQQKEGFFTLRLWGPLGSGNILIEGEPGKVTLTDGKETYQADSAEQLLWQQTGWLFPVENLHYWIRGLPVADVIYAVDFDEYNHITQLQQYDWQIDYLQFTAIKNIDLPSRMDLTTDNLTLRLIIYEWETT